MPRLLLTPGPVAIPDFVMDALRKPVIYHRTEEFEHFYASFLVQLRALFQTEQRVCSLLGSGTAGVEAAMYSTFHKGERVLVLENGKFSKRWTDYAGLIGLEVIPLRLPWGKSFAPTTILDALERNPGISGIVLTHCETSTGVCLDLEEIAFAVKRHHPHILLLVDAITTLGAIPFYFDAWQIDLAVLASQKALMSPAGLVAFACSELALEKMHPTHKSDYFNLYNYLKAAESFSVPYTPPVQILYAVQAALTHILEIGLPRHWNQVHRLSRLFKDGIQKLGGEIFGESPSDSLTAFGFEATDLLKLKHELIQQYDIHLSGGQDELEGKILRVSHMGYLTEADMKRTLEAIEKILM